MSDKAEFPPPLSHRDEEIQATLEQAGANFIVPGIEFGPIPALQETIMIERADAARQRLLGPEAEQEKAE